MNTIFIRNEDKVKLCIKVSNRCTVFTSLMITMEEFPYEKGRMNLSEQTLNTYKSDKKKYSDKKSILKNGIQEQIIKRNIK